MNALITETSILRFQYVQLEFFPINSTYPHLSEEKLVAEVMTSSCVDTITGILRQPGDFSILTSNFMVSCRMLAGHMSILVTTTNTGTLRASAKPRCSIGQ